MHTAHISAYYWHQWKQSGGRFDFDRWDRWVPMGGNLEWFNLYWRECDKCAAPGACGEWA